MASANESIEAVVCNVKDMGSKLPSMKEVDVGTAGKCLLIRHEDGEFTALGHKCTHYGAPLARGALSNGTVRCPWHGACFNSRTGDIEDYPGLDSLHKYQVTVDKRNGEVKVRANLKQLIEIKRNSCLESCVDAIGKDQSVVIVGGGPATLVCAETLRKCGFVGQISIICKEHHLPYDRAKLSKALDADAASVHLRSGADYFQNINVQIHNDVEAISVDCDKKSVNLSKNLSQDLNDANAISYDKLFIATGGKPRTLHPMVGWDCSNVHVLRTLDDANKIASSCKDKNVVLVGSSFIGMEIASYLAKKKECTSISVVCGKRSKVPFEPSLGAAVGGCIMKMHQEKGVVFHTATGLSGLIVNENTQMVSQVKLTNDTTIDADVVILGIGVTPATEFLKNSGITVNERGYVPVDCGMRTNVPDVYAGGDIVVFPLSMKEGAMTNIQHWQMAHAHGRIAAKSIVRSYTKEQGDDESACVPSVPFFWTVQFGISIRYAGHGVGFDDVIIKGIEKSGKVVGDEAALAAKKFAAFYYKNSSVVAVATMMADPIAARFAEKVKRDGCFRISEIDAFLRDDKGKSGKEGCNVS